MSFPRLRLTNGGTQINPDSYLRVGRNEYVRPSVIGVQTALTDGATMSIESVEELNKPVALLCQALEREIEVVVGADLYAGVAEKNEEPPRWNDHDLMVLQLEGQRYWQVYSPTGYNPTVFAPPPEPSGESDWEGLMSRGAVLYIPRGWWYRDQSRGASLVLGVKFKKPLAPDLLTYLSDGLCRVGDFSMSLPRRSDVAAQSVFIQRFRSEVNRWFGVAGFMEDFWGAMKESAESRNRFNLPSSVISSPDPLPDEFTLELLLRFPEHGVVRRTFDGTCAKVFVDGRAVSLSRDAAEIVDHLATANYCSIGDLCHQLEDTRPRAQVLAAIRELAASCVVSIGAPQ